MNEPTEPGRYYTNCGIIKVEFHKEKGGLCTHESSGGGPGAWSGWFRIGDKRAPMQYKWGARLPGSDTITAMRELAASSPVAYDDDDRPYCRYCDSMLEEFDHLDKCSWQRAQEKPDAEAC